MALPEVTIRDRRNGSGVPKSFHSNGFHSGPGIASYGTVMADVLDDRRAIAVRVDHSTLRAETVGTDTRYTVALTGVVDARWTETYRATQGESTGYRRFRLDPSSRTISFSCRTVDGTAHVFEALDRLEALLSIVNQQIGA
jgi:hypothetical protein